MHLEFIVAVGVLVNKGIRPIRNSISSGYNIQVIVTDIRMRSDIHSIIDFPSLQLRQRCLRMGLFNGRGIVCIAKEEIVDTMRHIQTCYFSLHFQPRVDVVVGMTTEMEIPWNLLHSKIALEVATQLITEGFSGDLILLVRVSLSQQFEILTLIDFVSLRIYSIFFDRRNVGTV